MIRMTGQMVVKQHNDFLTREALRKAKGAYVTVGVHEDAGSYTASDANQAFEQPSVVEVAFWQEFGTRTIPERSFLRAAFDENIGLINQWRDEAIRHMVHDGWTVRKALSMIGFRMMVLVQNKIKSNVPPPLAIGTAEDKLKRGVAPRTLIDSGLLLRSIHYKVVVPNG